MTPQPHQTRDADEGLFERPIRAVREAMMAVENADFVPTKDDPRNLDPEDEPLEDMYFALSRLEDAVEGIRRALTIERQHRQGRIEAMSEAEYETWEASVDA